MEGEEAAGKEVQEVAQAEEEETDPEHWHFVIGVDAKSCISGLLSCTDNSLTFFYGQVNMFMYEFNNL